MSPEIRVNNSLIAKVPDETGTYKTLSGGIIYINVNQVDADAKRQKITLESDEIGGRRILGLTHQGIGNSNDRKRGDKKDPAISVSLLDRPIRVTYSPQEPDVYGTGAIGRRPRQTVKNPRWIREHGQR